MKDSSRYYAIVTGASCGLGKALAEELARRGHALLLVSLGGTGLPELSEDITARFNVPVHYIETDLTRRDAPGKIREFAGGKDLKVDILVNNVGIGHGGEIGQYSSEAVEESVFLNMMSTTMMTNAFVSQLKERKEAHILNIGSFGGLMPVPYKSIYAATKSYIYHFSLAIREELKGTGVNVSVAMPGAILTNQKVRERIEKQGFVAKSFTIGAGTAAKYIIERMFRREGVILPQRTVRIAYGIGNLMPYRLLIALTGRLFRGVS